jgi:PAS domain S-box-containing protein
MNLTRRLLLLAFISVLPAIAIWTYTEVTLRREREAEVRELALRQAQLASSEIERIFEGVRSLLVAVGEVSSVQALDTPACVAYLTALQPKVPYLVSIVALDLNGAQRCRQQEVLTQVSYEDRSYFRQAITTERFVVGQYTRGRVRQEHALPLALPLRDKDGVIKGVLVAALDLTWFGRQISERSLPRDGSITIADSDGIILAREPFPERFVGNPIPEGFRPLISGDKPGAMEVISQDGTKRVLGYIPAASPASSVYVSAGLSSKAAFSTINEAAKRGFMLIAAAFILALSLAWLSGRAFVTKPFDKMTSAVRAWRRGNYGARIDLPRGSGEMGLLADAFNELMDDIAARQTALQESEERARLALEAGHMGTWWFNPVQRGGGYSKHAAALLGLADDSTSMSTPAEWQQAVHPDDRAAVAQAVEKAMRGGGDFKAEFRVCVKGNAQRWIDSRGRVFFDDARKPVRVVGIVQDITERKQAETQQRFLLDELNHRVKNTLATVQSIASQTLRSTSEPKRFRDAFESRLLALSKTHDLLTRNGWREADLSAIVEQELAPYRREKDDRIIVSGPKVSLPARAAINIGLVVHELTTNAVKYGALSVSQGHLDLRWSIATHADGSSMLHASWRERNGPAVPEPTRRGFGSKLLQRSIEGELSGRVTLRFASSGVTCDIEIPLPSSGTVALGTTSPLAIAV